MIVVGDDDMNGNLKEKTEQFLRVNLCHVLKVVRSLVVVPFSAIYYTILMFGGLVGNWCFGYWINRVNFSFGSHINDKHRDIS